MTGIRKSMTMKSGSHVSRISAASLPFSTSRSSNPAGVSRSASSLRLLTCRCSPVRPPLTTLRLSTGSWTQARPRAVHGRKRDLHDLNECGRRVEGSGEGGESASLSMTPGLPAGNRDAFREVAQCRLHAGGNGGDPVVHVVSTSFRASAAAAPMSSPSRVI